MKNKEKQYVCLKSSCEWMNSHFCIRLECPYDKCRTIGYKESGEVKAVSKEYIHPCEVCSPKNSPICTEECQQVCPSVCNKNNKEA